MALNPWLVIIIWAIILIVMTGPLLTLPIFWSRRKPDPFRDMPFESGQVPQGEGRHRLVMQYYPYLLMFVVFDVVGMFLLCSPFFQNLYSSEVVQMQLGDGRWFLL